MYLRNSSLFFWNYGSCSSFNCAWACKTKVLFESNICCSFAEDFCLVFLTAPFYVKHVPLYFMIFCTYFKFLFFGTKTIIPQKKSGTNIWFDGRRFWFDLYGELNVKILHSDKILILECFLKHKFIKFYMINAIISFQYYTR